MEHSIVKIEQLSHRYTAVNWAVRDVNLEITHNGIVGFLGSNGAGKSTTMNILCGALNPTEGNIWVNGVDMRKDPRHAKTQIGFLPQNPPLYMDLTVDEYLNYCAGLRQIPVQQKQKAIAEVKRRCGIDHFSHRLIKNLSGGYRQRVGIAQAIVHKPKIVVLDEPTNGLDPNQIIEVRSLIRDIAAERLVIFSSHVLSEVQLLCKEVVMIENGRIVFSDTMDAFNNYVVPHSIAIRFDSMPLSDELEAIPGISEVEVLSERKVRVYFSGDQDVIERIVDASVLKGWRLKEISLEKNSLEEIFKKLSQQTF